MRPTSTLIPGREKDREQVFTGCIGKYEGYWRAALRYLLLNSNTTSHMDQKEYEYGGSSPLSVEVGDSWNGVETLKVLSDKKLSWYKITAEEEEKKVITVMW